MNEINSNSKVFNGLAVKIRDKEVLIILFDNVVVFLTISDYVRDGLLTSDSLFGLPFWFFVRLGELDFIQFQGSLDLLLLIVRHRCFNRVK